jgi:hypothetical protein
MYAEAAESLRKAIFLQPDDPATAMDLAVLLLSYKGPDEEKLAALRHLLKLSPNEHQAYISLGQLYKSKTPKFSGTEEAREAFMAAIHIAPNDHTTHLNMADLLVYSRNSSAIDAYFTALELAPNSLELWNNMGHAWDSLTPIKTKEVEYSRKMPAVDKCHYCHSKHQELRMRQVNAERGAGRCKLRLVSEWMGEPGVRVTELEPEKVGEWYGAKHPLVVDMTHLEGFRLSNSKWHQHMYYQERRMYIARFTNVKISGVSALIQDECRVFLMSQGGYTWLHPEHGFPPPDSGKEAKLVKLVGTVAAMTQQAQHLYFHWLLECLVRLAILAPLLKQAGGTGGRVATGSDGEWIDTLLVPKFGRMSEVATDKIVSCASHQFPNVLTVLLFATPPASLRHCPRYLRWVASGGSMKATLMERFPQEDTEGEGMS